MNKIKILKEQIKELKELLALKDKRIQELSTPNFIIQYPQTIMNPIVYPSIPAIPTTSPSPYPWYNPGITITSSGSNIATSGSNVSSFESGKVFTTGQWEPVKN